MSRSTTHRRTVGAALVALISCLGVLVGTTGPAAAAAGVISGTVTGDDNGGQPLSGMRVRVYRAADLSPTMVVTSTEPDGTYSLPALPPGSYRVGFSDPYSTYADEYLDDAPTVATGRDIVVTGTAGATADAVLSPAESISGRVSDAGNAGLGGVVARAFQRIGSTWVEIRSTPTEADGDYELAGLRPGVYRVGFEDSAGTYATESWADKRTLDDAQDVAVGGPPVPDIDAQLALAGRVSGQVVSAADGSGLRDADVIAYRKVDGGYEQAADLYTNPDGTYDLGGLPAGTYRIAFTAPGHATAYWAGAATLAAATDVSVVAGSPVDDVGGALTPLGAAAPVTPSVTPSVTPPSPAATASAVTVLRQPRVRGRLVVGRRAKVVPGSYSPTATVSYAWSAGGTTIRGATRSSLRLTGTVRGKRLRVTVTATVPGAAPVVTVLRLRGRVR